MTKQEKKLKVLSVFGTRPEAIKMAPVVKALSSHSGVESVVAVTAQHREMLDQVLEAFGIIPDHDLDLMRPGQSLEDVTAAALRGLCEVIRNAHPDLVLVHGDTTTAFAGALAAFYQQVPCGHVEAGLRTTDRYSPFPEEMNRRLAGELADYHFAPTEAAREALLREQVPADRIWVTGNTVIDALLDVCGRSTPAACPGPSFDPSRRMTLLTCHRRENWGKPMREIFAAIRDTVARHPEVEVIFPVHKNPLVREAAHQFFDGLSRIKLVEPLDYLDFCRMLQQSFLVLTDSGGLQEEAPALGKPVLVLRDVTERPEAIEAGVAMLAGTTRESVSASLELLLSDEDKYRAMAVAANPFGDGTAAQRIVEIIMGIKDLQK